jgi:transposase-like protein
MKPDPSKTRKIQSAVQDYLVRGLTADQVARLYSISRVTVFRWVRWFLSQPESESLKRLDTLTVRISKKRR